MRMPFRQILYFASLSRVARLYFVTTCLILDIIRARFHLIVELTKISRKMKLLMPLGFKSPPAPVSNTKFALRHHNVPTLM